MQPAAGGHDVLSTSTPRFRDYDHPILTGRWDGETPGECICRLSTRRLVTTCNDLVNVPSVRLACSSHSCPSFLPLSRTVTLTLKFTLSVFLPLMRVFSAGGTSFFDSQPIKPAVSASTLNSRGRILSWKAEKNENTDRETERQRRKEWYWY